MGWAIMKNLEKDLSYKCISNPKDYGVGHFQVSINLLVTKTLKKNRSLIIIGFEMTTRLRHRVG